MVRGERKSTVTKKEVNELKHEVSLLNKKVSKMQEEFAEIIAEPQKAIFEAFGMASPAEIGSEYDKIIEDWKGKKNDKDTGEQKE